ncbi:MAG: putative baseplate assembly protein [candidate division Zixibacteria bacterium]
MKARDTLNGIDYLEVASVTQKTLKVHFLHPLPEEPNQVPPSPAPLLKKENIRIEGGIRIKNIHVVGDVGIDEEVLTVKVNQAGDFSKYTLRIVNSPTDSEPPSGFDVQLSTVDFSFKANCPSDLDCKAMTVCPREKLFDPRIDYLTKDYASFRRLMLDRLSNIMPDWRERNTADMQIALVELLSYVGDHLSYYQDAVATETYLGTARRRISARRHARLLDYFVHDGCNARTWVHFEIEEGGGAESNILPKGTILMTKGPDGKAAVASPDLRKVLDEQRPDVFETKHDLKLHSSHNKICFYTWSDSECCLPRGSTRATLRNDPSLSLEPEHLLIFEEVLSPTKGTKSDADPSHRHAVRLKHVEAVVDQLTGTPVLEIEWYEKDALPFPLCLSTLVKSSGGISVANEISVARGNVVLADHGRTLETQEMIPKSAPDDGEFRPRLQHTDITVAVPYDHSSAKLKAAATALTQDPREAIPSVWLDEGDETWRTQRDLLGSDRFATEFVVEIERDDTAQIRFGDDVLGKKPAAGFEPSATYRVGTGRTGNLGAETICRVEWDSGGIDSVRNPMPATGGIEAETMEEIRQFAPQAFRTQERAVTETDYAEKTQLHSEVQKAAARFRWTGSWYTVFITVDRRNARDVDTEFKGEICRHLEQYRMAGYDLEIRGPLFVPLDIVVNVCVKPEYFRNHVKESLLQVFSRYDLPDGRRGFFHPDNFTFGQPVYLSAIYKRAMEVAGVASVEAKKFRRWAKKSNNEKEKGLLLPANLEIARLDNDLNFPENGKIDFLMYGGL